jgi:hypothetical protein
MVTEKTILKIKSWYTRSMSEEDPFISFMCDYFCLVAFLTHMYPQFYSDGEKINKFLENLKFQKANNQVSERESQIAEKFHNNLDTTTIKDHLLYLKKFPLKYKKSRGRFIELRINDLDDDYNMIRYLQYVRNNLFHEIKLPEDDRDKHIIKIGCDIITPFIKSLIEYYGIFD